jgi:hypothetical protein
MQTRMTAARVASSSSLVRAVRIAGISAPIGTGRYRCRLPRHGRRRRTSGAVARRDGLRPAAVDTRPELERSLRRLGVVRAGR